MQLRPLSTCLPHSGWRVGWIPSLKAGLWACLGSSLPPDYVLFIEQHAWTRNGGWEIKKTQIQSLERSNKNIPSTFFVDWKGFEWLFYFSVAIAFFSFSLKGLNVKGKSLVVLLNSLKLYNRSCRSGAIMAVGGSRASRVVCRTCVPSPP